MLPAFKQSACRPSCASIEMPVVMGPWALCAIAPGRDDERVCFGCRRSPLIVRSRKSIATIVLAGAGKMGGAMLSGWLAQGLDAKRVVVVEPHPSQEISALAARGVRLNPSPKDIGAVATLVVALKPQMFREAGADAEIFCRLNHAGGVDHGRNHHRGPRGGLRRQRRPRHAEHAGGDRPRHHGGGGGEQRQPLRSVRSPTRCCAPPDRWNGSMTRT